MCRLALSFVLGFAATASAAVLWDQSAVDYSVVATVDQEFGDYPDYSTYQVCDIKVSPPGWNVGSVTTYYTQGWGSWFGVSQARLNIFKKVSSLPGGSDDPTAGAVVNVTVTSVDGGQGWAVKASGLAKTLTPGEYWVGLTPIADFGIYGQEFHTAYAAGIMGAETAIRNPGGAFGFGKDWTGVSTLGYGPLDGGIKIEGPLLGGGGDLLLTSFFTNNVLRYHGATGAFVGVFASGGGLDGPNGIAFGPDGNLYVTSYHTDSVLRYNGATGEFMDVFVPPGSGGLQFAQNLVFAGGDLYVVAGEPEVLRYDGTTGAFIDVFASEGLLSPDDLIFGPDGNLYVSDVYGDDVKRYDGTTGKLIDIFASGGGLHAPLGLAFGPDKNFYVASAFTDQVLRYHGATGEFMDVFASGGGIDNPVDVIFRPDGYLYVNGFWSNNVVRYDAATGAFVDVFVPPGSGGLNGSAYMVFMPGSALVGDMNCDGVVNAFDIDPFVLALTDPAGYVAKYPECDIMHGDVNGDGKVDAFDIDPFVELLTGG